MGWIEDITFGCLFIVLNYLDIACIGEYMSLLHVTGKMLIVTRGIDHYAVGYSKEWRSVYATLFQDSIEIVQHFGRPTLFIANPKSEKLYWSCYQVKGQLIDPIWLGGYFT